MSIIIKRREGRKQKAFKQLQETKILSERLPESVTVLENLKRQERLWIDVYGELPFEEIKPVQLDEMIPVEVVVEDKPIERIEEVKNEEALIEAVKEEIKEELPEVATDGEIKILEDKIDKEEKVLEKKKKTAKTTTKTSKKRGRPSTKKSKAGKGVSKK